MTMPSSDPWGRGRRAEQATNLLGALGVAVTDETNRAITRAAGQAGSDATLLSALRHFLDSPRIDHVAQVLALTSSGTVRLVDRLEKAGLVRRAAGSDGRATTIGLTAAGRRRAVQVSDARNDVLVNALATLTPAEREQFGRLAGKIITAIVRTRLAHRSDRPGWLCRLCDLESCGRPEGQCPAAAAAAGATTQSS